MRSILLLIITLILFSTAESRTRRSVILYQSWRDAKIAMADHYPDTRLALDEIHRPRVKFLHCAQWFDKGNGFDVVGLFDSDLNPQILIAEEQPYAQLRVTITHEFLHYLCHHLLAEYRLEESTQWIHGNY